MPESVAGKSACTLVIDVGGSGLKATVLDADGEPLHERVRIDTAYPCPPDKLVGDLVGLVEPLPVYERVSVGFPGVVRGGRAVTAPHFVTTHGPGTKIDSDLVSQWDRFDLAVALAARFDAPVRVANDADVQGAGVITGDGLELVLTLGTGLGSAVFRDGRLALHLSWRTIRRSNGAPTTTTSVTALASSSGRRIGTVASARRSSRSTR